MAGRTPTLGSCEMDSFPGCAPITALDAPRYDHQLFPVSPTGLFLCATETIVCHEDDFHGRACRAVSVHKL